MSVAPTRLTNAFAQTPQHPTLPQQWGGAAGLLPSVRVGYNSVVNINSGSHANSAQNYGTAMPMQNITAPLDSMVHIQKDARNVLQKWKEAFNKKDSNIMHLYNETPASTINGKFTTDKNALELHLKKMFANNKEITVQPTYIIADANYPFIATVNSTCVRTDKNNVQHVGSDTLTFHRRSPHEPFKIAGHHFSEIPSGQTTSTPKS